MGKMTRVQKNKYKAITSQAKQLCFDPEAMQMDYDKEGRPLYICMGKFRQYCFSRFPAEDDKVRVSSQTETDTAAEPDTSETDIITGQMNLWDVNVQG
ncbi:MAG: hypothetical protein HUJ76_01200 [Parasporobacterium sp.]|nr:hypothetical protein [Parasporobacterium sp.]